MLLYIDCIYLSLLFFLFPLLLMTFASQIDSISEGLCGSIELMFNPYKWYNITNHRTQQYIRLGVYSNIRMQNARYSEFQYSNIQYNFAYHIIQIHKLDTFYNILSDTVLSNGTVLQIFKFNDMTGEVVTTAPPKIHTEIYWNYQKCKTWILQYKFSLFVNDLHDKEIPRRTEARWQISTYCPLIRIWLKIEWLINKVDRSMKDSCTLVTRM